MPAKIIVRDLVKHYGAVEAVRGVSFEVEAGTVFGLLGPNGAGKTSVVECVLGLRRPDAGQIVLDGINALDEPARVKPRIGAALQSTALQDRITPREALRLFGAFYPSSVAPAVMLARFDLADRADVPFATLSGGQRQRLALALALLHEPDIIFLDEPTAGLDPRSRRELHDCIPQLRAEGRTVLLTTHDLEEAERLCDCVAVLQAGRVIAAGRPAEVIARGAALARVAVRTATALDLAAVRRLSGISGAENLDGEVQIEVEQVGPAVIALVRLLEETDNELLDLRVWQPSLEDSFMQLTAEKNQEPSTKENQESGAREGSSNK